MRSAKIKAKKGFTLIELIIVIAILAILAGILVPSLMGYIGNSKSAVCRSNVGTLNRIIYMDITLDKVNNDEAEVKALLEAEGYHLVCAADDSVLLTFANDPNGVLQCSCPTHGSGDNPLNDDERARQFADKLYNGAGASPILNGFTGNLDASGYLDNPTTSRIAEVVANAGITIDENMNVYAKVNRGKVTQILYIPDRSKYIDATEAANQGIDLSGRSPTELAAFKGYVGYRYDYDSSGNCTVTKVYLEQKPITGPNTGKKYYNIEPNASKIFPRS